MSVNFAILMKKFWHAQNKSKIEDGVALKSKAQARQNIRRILDKESTIDFGRSELTVRVNSLRSGLCHADLEAVFGGLHIDNAPSSIHLPKVDDPEVELIHFARKWFDKVIYQQDAPEQLHLP